MKALALTVGLVLLVTGVALLVHCVAAPIVAHGVVSSLFGSWAAFGHAVVDLVVGVIGGALVLEGAK